MIIHDVEQGSDAWHGLRNMPTASQASRIITPAKGEYSSQAKKYQYDLLNGFLGDPVSKFKGNTFTERGHEFENDAFEMFEYIKGLTCQKVGFITNDDKTAGCSPDGFQTNLEIKCPIGSTHLGYLEKNEVPNDYLPQIHMSMAVTGERYWWFMSYHPKLSPLIKLVKWSTYTDRFIEHLDRFLKEFEALKVRALAA